MKKLKFENFTFGLDADPREVISKLRKSESEIVHEILDEVERDLESGMAPKVAVFSLGRALNYAAYHELVMRQAS